MALNGHLLNGFNQKQALFMRIARVHEARSR